MNEANSFVEAVENSDRTVMCLPHFGSQAYKIRQMIAEGAIGRVSGARYRTSHGGPEIYYAEIRDLFGETDDDLWFFDCHFKEDPVMPGCLGLDAMWQLVGFYLGWLGNPGKGRALGVGAVKFTGEVLQDVKNVRYEIDMKKIMSPGGTTVGLANGVVFADNKKIYSADSLKVGLFK